MEVSIVTSLDAVATVSSQQTIVTCYILAKLKLHTFRMTFESLSRFDGINELDLDYSSSKMLSLVCSLKYQATLLLSNRSILKRVQKMAGIVNEVTLIGGIKAKGYDVIGVRVFPCKLMRFLRKKIPNRCAVYY